MGIRLVPLTQNRERRGPLISADKKGFGLDTLVEEFFFSLSLFDGGFGEYWISGRNFQRKLMEQGEVSLEGYRLPFSRCIF